MTHTNCVVDLLCHKNGIRITWFQDSLSNISKGIESDLFLRSLLSSTAGEVLSYTLRRSPQEKKTKRRQIRRSEGRINVAESTRGLPKDLKTFQ